MKTIEEQLWSYIDGNCTAEEKSQIEAKLAINLQYYQTYQGLLAVNNELAKLDFEEPSMSFTRNVMDRVNLEIKPVALKTKVDNRIVYSIMGFFVLSLLGIFGYAVATSDLNFSLPLAKLDFQTGIEKIINPTTFKIFLMIDAVLILLYVDSYFRKSSTQKKGA